LAIGYTLSVKTAISLPDALFAEAETTAKSMGIPRSQLFARAVEEYLNHHNKERITKNLNTVSASAGDNIKTTTAGLDAAQVSGAEIDRIKPLVSA